MNEKNPQKAETRNWLERLGDILHREPQDQKELIDLLRDANQRKLLNANALTMIERVLQLSLMQVRDIMIPRSHMVILHESDAIKDLLPTIIDSGHSRFPVIREDRDEIVGILLAKDLLEIAYNQNTTQQSPDIRDILRSAVFVPESKRLDVLLQEFRLKHNHMAIVVDEYGGIAGLVTIEDILEEIVGNIEDEYDIDEETFIKKQSDREYIVKALMPIEAFNEDIGAKLNDEEADTIGGLVIQAFGRLPKPGEITTIDQYEFKVLNADNRRIRLLQMTIKKSSADDKKND